MSAPEKLKRGCEIMSTVLVRYFFGVEFGVLKMTTYLIFKKLKLEKKNRERKRQSKR